VFFLPAFYVAATFEPVSFRDVTVLTSRKEKASELLPRVHLVISLLKRWLMGTHQGQLILKC
jgi:hypothetical protein